MESNACNSVNQVANLVAALHASDPVLEQEDVLGTFGQFIGSWDLDWYIEGARAKGELHFGWVLGGRAIQDVWVVPGRFHGSTLRFYDRALGAWRSTWIEPDKRMSRPAWIFGV